MAAKRSHLRGRFSFPCECRDGRWGKVLWHAALFWQKRTLE